MVATATRPTKRKSRKYNGRDLVFLVYSPNICYTNLVVRRPEGVTVDLEAGTWSYGDHTFKIGEFALCFYARGGVPIGVFDRTKLPHLREMLEAQSDATARPGLSDD